MSGTSTPPVWSTATVGSGSCMNIEGDTVNLYNYCVGLNSSQIAANEYVGSWATAYTGIFAETNSSSALSAVFVTDIHGNQKVHVFYNGQNGVLQGLYMQVAPTSGWLTNDQGLNSLNISGCVPRSAIGWADYGGTHIRIYCVINTGQDGDTINCELHELAIDNDTVSGPNVIATFTQNGTQAFGDGTAAITWVDSSGVRQFRVYCYATWNMVEYEASFPGNGWSIGMNWYLLPDEQSRPPITAVVYNANNANHIRVYRHMDRQSHPNTVHEWSWDDGTAKWTDQDLDHDIIAGTYGPAQPSSLAWVTTDGQVHIRLYQLMGDPSLGVLGNPFYITESSFDTDTGWTANTNSLPSSTVETP